MSSQPGSAFASMTAARSVQAPAASAHTPFPGAASTASLVVLTANTAADATPVEARSARQAVARARAMRCMTGDLPDVSVSREEARGRALIRPVRRTSDLDVRARPRALPAPAG